MFDESVKNLMFDYGVGKEIIDDGVKISSDDVNEKIRTACFNLLGLNEKSSPRDVTRALKKDAALELFAIIEEILDKKIETGFNENEFFNEFVETRNIADGDDVEFVVDEDVVLNVAKVSGSNHDLIMQKLPEGTPFTVPTSVYGIKVGTDIRLFLTGKRDWAKWVDTAAKSLVKKVQGEVYTETMNASSQIPASTQFNKSGAIGNATKATFDTLIEDVETANGVPAVIMGTKTALKKLNGFADVDWIADSQKESFANTGIMGRYEGTLLVEIPQRFADNDTATKLVDNTKLLIMPQIENKFVKVVDYGETTLEVTEVGATMNDQQSYEITRRIGVGTVITKYFGTWTIL